MLRWQPANVSQVRGLEQWNDGMVEWWNVGIPTIATQSFYHRPHRSNTPLFHQQDREHILRLPPRRPRRVLVWPPVDQVQFHVAAAAEGVDHRAEGDVDRAVEGGQLVGPSPPPKATARSVTSCCVSRIDRWWPPEPIGWGGSASVTPLVHSSGRALPWPKGASCSIWPTTLSVKALERGLGVDRRARPPAARRVISAAACSQKSARKASSLALFDLSTRPRRRGRRG